MTEKRNSLKNTNCFSRYGKYTLFLASIGYIWLLKILTFLQNEYRPLDSDLRRNGHDIVADAEEHVLILNFDIV